MGLQCRHTGNLHAIICKGISPQVSEPHSKPTPALPTPMEPPNYGSTAPQLSHQAPESLKLSLPESNTVKQAVGNFLYYARTVDTTMLVALNSITAEQANSIESTAKPFTKLLNYSAKHHESITRYHSSSMILHIHSDTPFYQNLEQREEREDIIISARHRQILKRPLPSNHHSMYQFMSNAQPLETS